MLQIDQIQDPAALRQAAVILERENQKLHAKVQELLLEIARLRGQDLSRAQQRLALELERLQQLSVERETLLQQGTALQAEATPPPRRGHGPREQPELPIEERWHELPETERTCSVCQGMLEPLGDQAEDSEEITVVERRFVVVKQRRRKYRCRCNANVVTAPGPAKLQPGSRYSIAFAVEVAAAKYLDHLPLERQCRIMRREGLRIDSQTLWDQLNVLAHHLQIDYVALRERVLQAELVHADETSWRLLRERPSQRWWVWELACHDAACYALLDNRSEASALELLGDYRGIVMADGYGVYETLSCEGVRFKLANCWAHARRKFADIEPDFPESREILRLIGELYAIESEVPELRPWTGAETRQEILSLRARLRRERSQVVIDTIRDWLYAQRPLPESGFGKAVRYVLGRWYGLTAFLSNPLIPLDNNHGERVLRGVVLGRKNHYGSRSKRGTEVAAIFYSLFESAKLCGVEPKSYVQQAARAAITDGATLLPHSLMQNP